MMRSGVPADTAGFKKLAFPGNLPDLNCAYGPREMR